ncbi:Transcriptional regulator MntR [bioreactor metagenome]|uniref:DtxR family iron (Metal) dependent repressor n=2 Tax=root TaxID=1 RepID=A0A562JE37_9FIRM|nr:metal-dependent transcriptional regulator [Sedimentibacter saalensis]TWH81411.1 DtxR family iron (metal) dependent repressor [Sedimentibacter saalensis]
MDEYYTLRGYKIKNEEVLSSSMEDYIEMIYRISFNSREIRVNELSEALNVQPPSTTKMIKRLSREGYVCYEKYGFIKLTDKGNDIGEYLLKRHKTIYEFLKIIGIEKDLLEQTEKLEHAINENTLLRIKELTDFLNNCSEYEKNITET